MKKPLIVLTGPTAVGKSALSIALCHAVNGAVVSADSMQVYRGMDIGSAKITREEMDHVPHYLIDVLDPSEEFNIALFQKLAKEAMEEIYAEGKIPVLVGGTGFYIHALLYDTDFENQDNSQVRLRLEEEAKILGPHALHERLKEIDPVSYETIHENNVKRVIRALEFYQISGKRISDHNEEESQKASPYNFAYFVLNDDRSAIYERIDRRVDLMLEAGLVQEVEKLKALGLSRENTSMQGLGYKEILDYLNGDCSLDEAAYTIKRDSRHFAKRQLTWFRREKEVIWVNKNEFGGKEDEILSYMLEELKKKDIL